MAIKIQSIARRFLTRCHVPAAQVAPFQTVSTKDGPGTNEELPPPTSTGSRESSTTTHAEFSCACRPGCPHPDRQRPRRPRYRQAAAAPPQGSKESTTITHAEFFLAELDFKAPPSRLPFGSREITRHGPMESTLLSSLYHESLWAYLVQ